MNQTLQRLECEWTTGDSFAVGLSRHATNARLIGGWCRILSVRLDATSSCEIVFRMPKAAPDRASALSAANRAKRTHVASCFSKPCPSTPSKPVHSRRFSGSFRERQTMELRPRRPVAPLGRAKAIAGMRVSIRFCPGGQVPDWPGTGPSDEVNNCVSSPRSALDTVRPGRPRPIHPGRAFPSSAGKPDGG